MLFGGGRHSLNAEEYNITSFPKKKKNNLQSEIGHKGSFGLRVYKYNQCIMRRGWLYKKK